MRRENIYNLKCKRRERLHETAHHFPPYHIEAAQTPVCVVSNFLRFIKI